VRVRAQRVEQVVEPQIMWHPFGQHVHRQAGPWLLRPPERKAPGEHVHDVRDRGRDADPTAVTGLQDGKARVELEQPSGIGVVLVAIEAKLSVPLAVVRATRLVPAGLGVLEPLPWPAHADVELVGAGDFGISQRAGDPQDVTRSEQAARSPQLVRGTWAASVREHSAWRRYLACIDVLAHPWPPSAAPMRRLATSCDTVARSRPRRRCPFCIGARPKTAPRRGSRLDLGCWLGGAGQRVASRRFGWCVSGCVRSWCCW